jgi:hypothetical protein
MPSSGRALARDAGAVQAPPNVHDGCRSLDPDGNTPGRGARTSARAGAPRRREARGAASARSARPARGPLPCVAAGRARALSPARAFPAPSRRRIGARAAVHRCARHALRSRSSDGDQRAGAAGSAHRPNREWGARARACPAAGAAGMARGGGPEPRRGRAHPVLVLLLRRGERLLLRQRAEHQPTRPRGRRCRHGHRPGRCVATRSGSIACAEVPAVQR